MTHQFHSRTFIKEKWQPMFTKKVSINICNSFIWDSPELETTQGSLNRRKAKQSVVCPCYGILLSKNNCCYMQRFEWISREMRLKKSNYKMLHAGPLHSHSIVEVIQLEMRKDEWRLRVKDRAWGGAAGTAVKDNTRKTTWQTCPRAWHLGCHSQHPECDVPCHSAKGSSWVKWENAHGISLYYFLQLHVNL